MPLFKYYKQFEALTEEEVNVEKRAVAEQRKAAALARVEPLDLSRTTWPDFPPPAVVSAITFAARRGLHRYVDRHAPALRAELAHRHAVPVEQLVLGHGAAQLLSAAAQTLLEPGDELVTPWPSYALYPLMARRARGNAVPVPGFDVDALLAAVNPRTRIIALANPNDPTGELLPASELRRLLEALPERVVVLLDEALRDFVDAEPPDAALRLVDAFPRLVVFRTFSKAWGLAGLRVGYAIGGAGSASLLERLEPELGLDELAQAGALEALKAVSGLAAARGAKVAAARVELVAALRTLSMDPTPQGGGRSMLSVAPSQANVLWVRADGLPGAELSARLERLGVIVAGGGSLGDPERVRITVSHRPEDAQRLVRALELALTQA